MAIICQWCGLESQDENTCEWCRREIIKSALPPVPDPQQGALQDDDDEEETFFEIDPFGIRLEFFLAVALPGIALFMAAAWFTDIPKFLLAAGASFFVCFFLSVYQHLASIDHRYIPLGVAIALVLVFGSVAALVIFLLIWLVFRRMEAGTMVGLIFWNMVAIFLVAYAGTPEFAIAVKMSYGMQASLIFIAAVAGWMLANFWRPLNE